MFLRYVAIAALLVAPLYAQAPAKPAAQAEKLPDARELINRHIKAVGGREAVLSKKSMHALGTLSVPASGITAPVEIWGAGKPDRVLVKTSVPGVGEIMEGFDGTHAWSVNPMTGPMLKADKELAQTKLDADFYSELRDPAKYISAKTVEKTMFDDRECYKVALERIDGTADFDFYEVKSGLRAGQITTRDTSMGTMSMTTADRGYKKFGDLLQAAAVSQKVMGIEQIITISTVEFDKVDPSVFEPPAAIKALIK